MKYLLSSPSSSSPLPYSAYVQQKHGLVLCEYQRGLHKQGLNSIFRNRCQSTEGWKRLIQGEKSTLGRRKACTSARRHKKSNMPLETNNFGLTRGVMFVELQWHGTTAERKISRGPFCLTGEFELYPEEGRTHQRSLLLGKDQISLFWGLQIDFLI